MRSSRALALISTLALAAGCTSLLGDFTVSNTAGPGSDGGGTDGAGNDGSGADGAGGDSGPTDGNVSDAKSDAAPDAGGPVTCSLFTTGAGAPRKLLDYTDMNGNLAQVNNDFLVAHLFSAQDPHLFILFQPQGSSGVQSLNLRTNRVDTYTLELTPNFRPVFADRSGTAFYLFEEEFGGGTSASVYGYRIDDNSSQAVNGATKSPTPVFTFATNQGNTRYSGRAIDQNGTFASVVAVPSQTQQNYYNLYMAPSFSFTNPIATAPSSFDTVYGGTNGQGFSLDGSGLFPAQGNNYLLINYVDPSTQNAASTEYEFPANASAPTNRRPITPAGFFPILFNPTGTGSVDIGVALPNQDAAAGPFDTYFGRFPESASMTFNITTDPNIHKANVFTDPDRSPLGAQMGCFTSIPGTGLFVGRGQTPQSTGVNVFLFDIPNATTTFAAAGTGQNLLVGNTTFNKCAASYAGTVLGGAQTWDIVWSQAVASTPPHDEIWYASLYCSR
jgi:hypothetical protein